MAWIDFHFRSEILGLNCSAHLIVPQSLGSPAGDPQRKYPTLYLLHGLTDDHTSWLRWSSIERYATKRNLAVVMPAVGRSFYQNMHAGPRYWTFVSEELPRICQAFFPLATERENRFAAGLSMGGYGAMRLGLACPEKFAAVASLSGALDLARRLREAGRDGALLNRPEYIGAFGPDLACTGTETDLFFLAEKGQQSGQAMPQIYLGCGMEDPLIGETRAFRQHLDSLSWAVTYREASGAHDWGYWDGEIQRVVDWLPLKR